MKGLIALSTSEKTKKKDRNTAGIIGPDQIKYIAVYDIRSEPDKTCAVCGNEVAVCDLELRSAFHKKVLSMLLGPSCRTGIEAGLRAQRKWTTRGGAYLNKKHSKS